MNHVSLFQKSFYSLAPILLNLLSQQGGRPRLPPPLSDPPPETPETPAPRVPDPLEDFATFVSVCSKVYADQGECDLQNANWCLFGIRVASMHRKDLF